MDISSQLKKLDLPKDQFVVVGSGPLAIRGIREAKDLDIIVTGSLWDELAKKHPVELNSWGVERLALNENVKILNPAQSIFGNSKIVPMAEVFEKADVFDSVKFISLDHLKKIKLELGREIDLRDIELMDAYLDRILRPGSMQKDA